jgi:lytic murein transglycosylase
MLAIFSPEIFRPYAGKVQATGTNRAAGIIMRRTLLNQAGMALAVLLVAGVHGATAATTTCRNTGSFEAWLAKFKQDAVAQGISRNALTEAAPFMVYDAHIVGIDRGQKFFAQDFLQFSDKMLAGGRVQNGIAHIKKNAATFEREEREFGVPPAVIAGFWGLESDFGANQGNYNSIRSITTLAYDCRRSDMFRGHLFDELRLLERGDLTAAEMVGSWAGELGQTQMMPSEYLKNAVDYDGDGKRNLIRSASDVIGSTAKYLVSLGWKRGEPWLQEVHVSQQVPWAEADLTIQHTRAEWAKWGVTYPGGRALPADNMQASLLLPMGRFGPAFLAYDNFQVYLKWNNSLVYSTTAAYYSTRIAGAPAIARSTGPVPKVTAEEVAEIQRLLVKAGFDVGTIDGKVGTATRAAIKKMQIKFKLPADSYPSPELLARLRAGG